MENWQLLTRDSKIFEEPKVTIRKYGISFNNVLVKMLDKNLKYCEFYFQDKTIGIKFLTNKTNDSYTITNDGGGKARKSNNLFVACKSIILSHPALLQAQKNKQSFTCFFDSINSMWCFNITPMFLSTDVSLLNVTDIGLYKYLSEGEVIYIGQGIIKNRLTDSARNNWFYDNIEYFLCSKEDAVKYEKILLQEHLKLHGRLPFYNRQGVSK